MKARSYEDIEFIVEYIIFALFAWFFALLLFI